MTCANAFALDGRRVMITGAAADIGAATAQVCAGLGGDVLLVDCDPLDAVLRQIEDLGGKAWSLTADVADRTAVEALAAAAGPIDTLVRNAAICPSTIEWTRTGTPRSTQSWR